MQKSKLLRNLNWLKEIYTGDTKNSLGTIYLANLTLYSSTLLELSLYTCGEASQPFCLSFFPLSVLSLSVSALCLLPER